MEYGLIKISETKETFIENLLISLAGYTPQASSFSGYQFKVHDSLKDVLCFLDAEDDEFKCILERQLFRVYACAEEDVDEVLVVGDSLKGWGKVFVKENQLSDSVLSVHISSSCNEEIEWGLIGIAAPGWVLLFEEDLDYAVKDYLNDTIKVGYIPADESFLDSVGPSLNSNVMLQSLFELILQNLPRRKNRNDYELD